MAAVTAKMVKDLREMTGAGMMDCKKALSATDGDMDKAVEFLKDSIFQISFQEFDNGTLTVNEITLEYIVVNADDGKAYIRPAWRFVVGENKEQQNGYRDRIIAIDAVTGDLIQGRRGNNF